MNIYVKSYNFDFKIFLQICGRANRVYEEQDAGQILQGTAGNFETFTASGVLSLEASSADSQVKKFSFLIDRTFRWVSQSGDGTAAHTESMLTYQFRLKQKIGLCFYHVLESMK